jgi:hypothetical protein
VEGVVEELVTAQYRVERLEMLIPTEMATGWFGNLASGVAAALKRGSTPVQIVETMAGSDGYLDTSRRLIAHGGPAWAKYLLGHVVLAAVLIDPTDMPRKGVPVLDQLDAVNQGAIGRPSDGAVDLQDLLALFVMDVAPESFAASAESARFAAGVVTSVRFILSMVDAGGVTAELGLRQLA